LLPSVLSGLVLLRNKSNYNNFFRTVIKIEGEN